jgi:hypothetical protein
MENLQWHRFERKIYIDSTVEELYNFWVTQDGITTWFLKESQFVNSNDNKRKSNELIQTGDSDLAMA